MSSESRKADIGYGLLASGLKFAKDSSTAFRRSDAFSYAVYVKME
jgi:hypothetical protein